MNYTLFSPTVIHTPSPGAGTGVLVNSTSSESPSFFSKPSYLWTILTTVYIAVLSANCSTLISARISSMGCITHVPNSFSARHQTAST